MLFDYPIHEEDFEETKDEVICRSCHEGVADFTAESDYCIDCRKRHGALCGEPDCLADSCVVTQDGLMCQRHAQKYLESLVANAYQLYSQLMEEHDKVADKKIKVEHEEEGKESNPAEYQQQKYMLERMESNHSDRINVLERMVAEIQELQGKLEVELLDTSY